MNLPCHTTHYSIDDHWTKNHIIPINYHKFAGKLTLMNMFSSTTKESTQQPIYCYHKCHERKKEHNIDSCLFVFSDLLNEYVDQNNYTDWISNLAQCVYLAWNKIILEDIFICCIFPFVLLLAIEWVNFLFVLMTHTPKATFFFQ